jgi:hypothetical protein
VVVMLTCTVFSCCCSASPLGGTHAFPKATFVGTLYFRTRAFTLIHGWSTARCLATLSLAGRAERSGRTCIRLFGHSGNFGWWCMSFRSLPAGVLWVQWRRRFECNGFRFTGWCRSEKLRSTSNCMTASRWNLRTCIYTKVTSDTKWRWPVNLRSATPGEKVEG